MYVHAKLPLVHQIVYIFCYVRYGRNRVCVKQNLKKKPFILDKIYDPRNVPGSACF